MNTEQSPITLHWFKSSHSGGEGGECVEVATSPTAVHIRDSKDTGRGILTAGRQAWRDFVAAVSEA